MHKRKRSTQNWSRDLQAVQEQQVSFNEFATRHSGFIKKLAVRWLGSCPPHMQLDDVQQEIRIAIEDAIQRWDAERGSTLTGYVRRQVRYRILRHGERYNRKVVKEPCLVTQQIVEECVMYVPGAYKGDEDEHYVPVTWPNAEELYDARNRAKFMVGNLPAKQGTLVANLIVEMLGNETNCAGERRVQGSRKAVLRAITAALQVMELSSPRDELEPRIENGPDTHTENEREESTGKFLRPIRKVRESNSNAGQGQGQQSAAAS